MMASKVRSR